MATTVLGYKPAATGTYRSRIVHIPKDQVKAILGGASHQAWVELVKEGRTHPGSAVRVPNKLHKERTREIAQATFKEYILSQLK